MCHRWKNAPHSEKFGTLGKIKAEMGKWATVAKMRHTLKYVPPSEKCDTLGKCGTLGKKQHTSKKCPKV